MLFFWRHGFRLLLCAAQGRMIGDLIPEIKNRFCDSLTLSSIWRGTGFLPATGRDFNA
jgi:hypothetical protein